MAEDTSDQEREERHQEAVGSMSEEAAKLAAILQDWAARTQSGDPTAGLGELFGPNIATGAPECRVCPVCRTIAAARELGPDFYVNLGNVVSGLVAAAASAAADGSRGRGKDDAGSSSSPREDVERITLDDEDDLSAFDE